MARKSFPLVYAATRIALLPFYRGLVNKERIPTREPYVMLSNHSSFMDGVLMAFVFAHATKRPLHMVSVAQPFRHWFFGWALRSSRSIPLDRTVPDAGVRMIRPALGYLAMGEPVGVFPEGHVNSGRCMRRLRPGGILLALEAKVPILPVGIRNSATVLPMRSRFPKFKRVVEVHVGEAINIAAESEAYHSSDADERASLVHLLMNTVGERIALLAGQAPPRGSRTLSGEKS